MNLRTWAGVTTWQKVLNKTNKTDRACAALKLAATAGLRATRHPFTDEPALPFFGLEEHRSIHFFDDFPLMILDHSKLDFH
jgi:hypothetical protein